MDASAENPPSIILRHNSWNLPGLKTQILRSISGLDGSPGSGASEDERLTFEMAEPIATLTMHSGPSGKGGKEEQQQQQPESTPGSMTDLFRQFDDPSWSQIINGLFTELPPLLPEDLRSAEFLKLATPSSLGRGLMLPMERQPAHEMHDFPLLHKSYPLPEQAKDHSHMLPLSHSSLSHTYGPSAHPCFYPSPTACRISPQARHQTPLMDGPQGSPLPAQVCMHVRALSDEGADSDSTDEDAPAAKRGCFRQLADDAKPADSNASSGSFTGSDSSRKQRALSLKRAGSTSSGGRMKRQVCRNCGTHQTPQWRCGPEGPRTLCNACGVKYKKGQVLVPTADAAQLEAALM